MSDDTACSNPDCEKPAEAARGLCWAHYSKLRRAGGVPPRLSGEAAFRSHIATAGNADCWPWTGTVSKGGYGTFKFLGERTAHRIAWAIAHGPIPTGMCVLHRCDNPPCVNPAHLWLGTIADNNADRVRKGRTKNGGPGLGPHRRVACQRGHPFTPDNSYYRPNGTRKCRQCMKRRYDSP